MAYQDMAPDGTAAQNALLYQGQRSVVAAPILAFASLANGQTFGTITPALAADSRTINAALAASTDRPTFCAALAADLNTTGGGTTAFVWTVNGSGDGLIGTAKAPGDEFNRAPTGTALTGGKGSITTSGIDKYDDQATKLSALGFAGWLDTVSNYLANSAYCPGATQVRGSDLSMLPRALSLGASVQDAALEGGAIQIVAGGWTELTRLIIQNPMDGGVSWAFAVDAIIPVPAAGKTALIALKNAAGSQYLALAHAYATSQTHIQLQPSAGAPTAFMVADGLRHTYAVAYNGTTITILVDGVVAATGIAKTGLVTPSCIALYGDTAPVTAIFRIAMVTTG